MAGHVEVLIAHSEYCRALFSDVWWTDRHEDPILRLDQTLYFNAMPCVMEYFYTGDIAVVLGSADVLSAIMLAFELVASVLVDDLLPHIYSLIDKDNVMELLVVADLHNIIALKGRCLSFAIRQLIEEDLSGSSALQITSEAKSAMRTLRQTLHDSTEVNGDVYGDVRELIYMLRDAQSEAEAVYAESKSRNDEELLTCRAELRTIQNSYLRSQSREKSMSDYEKRLLKVQDTLHAQQAKLEMSAEYNRSRLAALDRVLALSTLGL